MTPLRVCLISEEYPPETGWGGIGTYVFNLAHGLAAAGHKVHVITRGWGADEFKEQDGINIHRLTIPEPSWRWGTYWVPLRFPETREIVLWSRRVDSKIRELHHRCGLDIIESPEYRAQGLATGCRQIGIPLVVKLHTPAYLCRRINGVTVGGSLLDTWISENLERLLARRAAVVTSPSRSLAQDAAQRWGLGQSAVRVVPYPMDEVVFSPGTAPSTATLLYVGRLERRKGVETVARALPEVLRSCPEVQMLFVGADHPSGPGGSSMQEYLRRLLAEGGVPPGATHFAGPKPRSELPDVYRSASICLVPSLYENFPFVCLEAMASGCTVVASAVGGIPEIISNNIDGMLVPPADAGALSRTLISLIRDTERCRWLGRAASETIRTRFSRQVISEQTAQFYRSVIQQHKSSRNHCRDR